MTRSSIFALGLCLAAASGCSEQQQEQPQQREQRAVNVIVEPLEFERARTRVEAVGTSRARLSAELYPATSGAVVSIAFEPGEFVQKGDVLVELDSREEKLALQLAEVQLADAERLFDRYQRSADSGAVIATVLDEARTAAETARIALERARIALADRTVRAVFAGHVGATEVDPGDRINADTMITTLDDRSSLLVSFDIPEVFIGELDVDDQVRLETWSANMPEVLGEIVDIGSRIDPKNRSFVARARVSNDDDLLRPGMSFRVKVDMAGQLYAVIAETGVQWGADGAFVWTVVGGEAVRVPVQVIERREGRVLVDAPLSRGAVIVVEGTHRMRDGVAVSFDQQSFVRQLEALPATGPIGNGPSVASWD